MNNRREILISAQVHDTILRATEMGHAAGEEAGGSLLCHDGEDAILVAYALPAGPAADHGPAHIHTDAAYQNTAMACVLRRCPKLDYAGDWHVHPMWLPTLSRIDRETARTILLSECQHRDSIVLLLGTWRPGHGPVIVGFLGRLGPDQELLIDEVPPRVVSDDDPEVCRRLGQPLPELAGLLAAPAPETVTHPAAARIQEDLQEIRQRLNAQADLWIGDEGVYARLRSGVQQAVVLFPPEYPHGAPRIFAGSLTAGLLEPIPLPYAWSSAHDLLDPVSVALTPPLRRVLRWAADTARLGLFWLRRTLILTAEELR